MSVEMWVLIFVVWLICCGINVVRIFWFLRSSWHISDFFNAISDGDHTNKTRFAIAGLILYVMSGPVGFFY